MGGCAGDEELGEGVGEDYGVGLAGYVAGGIEFFEVRDAGGGVGRGGGGGSAEYWEEDEGEGEEEDDGDGVLHLCFSFLLFFFVFASVVVEMVDL